MGLAPVPPAHAQPDRVGALLRQASQERSAGHARQADRILRRAQRAAPATDGRVALALAARLPDELDAPPSDTERARAEEAVEALDAFLDAAATTDPNVREAVRARTWARALASDHRPAIEDALRAAGLQDRANATLLRQLALLAVLRDDLASAAAALRGAHRAYPQDNEILTELAAVSLARGAPEAAVDAYQRVLGRMPDDVGIRRDLAGALLAAGRADGAVSLLEETLEAHPEDVDLWLELALASLEAHDPERAARAATEAITRVGPHDGRAHAALGSARAALGQHDLAVRAYREAIQRDPHELRASQGLEALAPDPP